MMKRIPVRPLLLIAVCVLLPAFARPAGAEIYADVALRHGATPLGTVRIELDAARAPRPVANFIGLATGQFPWIDPGTEKLMINTPYYDGLIFHRLIHTFMIQGGDPTGTGKRGPGYVFQDQFHPDLRHTRYSVSMAHSGPNTNGSQFFIMLTDEPWLDDLHSVFGVINDPASRAIIDGFTDENTFETEKVNKEKMNRPLTEIVIESVVIGGAGLNDFDLFSPALGLPRVNGVRAALTRVASAPGSPPIRMEWPAAYLHEYPVGLTADARSWGPIQNRFLVMNMEETLSLTPPKPAPDAAAFLRVYSVDFSSVPVAPIDIFQHGATLSMALHGGELVVVFGTGAPGDAGTWTYTAANQIVTSGTLAAAAAGAYSFADSPVYPDGSILMPDEIPEEIPDGVNPFRYLSVRALYLDFGQAEVGPYRVVDIETYLSFHHPSSGYFDDAWYNTNVALLPAQCIRGSFTWTPPE